MRCHQMWMSLESWRTLQALNGCVVGTLTPWGNSVLSWGTDTSGVGEAETRLHVSVGGVG